MVLGKCHDALASFLILILKQQDQPFQKKRSSHSDEVCTVDEDTVRAVMPHLGIFCACAQPWPLVDCRLCTASQSSTVSWAIIKAFGLAYEMLIVHLHLARM